MTRQQEFRKQTEEAKFEAFSLMCEKVAELEKENAELKELKKKKEEIEIMTNFCKTCKKMYTDLLSKAKEILQEYIRINLLPPIERNFDDEVKLFKQAEQFLKECK